MRQAERRILRKGGGTDRRNCDRPRRHSLFKEGASGVDEGEGGALRAQKKEEE